MLSKFIAETRQSSGEAYTPKTLLQFMTNLQAFEYTIHPRACHFMIHKDVRFQPLHIVLNNLSKRLLRKGIGAEKKQARVVTIEEENELWDKGVIGRHSPKSLQCCVFLLWHAILSLFFIFFLFESV